MNGRILGVVLGVVCTILWYMPWAYVTFMDVEAYQAGNHIEGIAYLVLLASLAYAVLSWLEQHIPRVIAASVILLVSVLFALQAAESVAWGVLALVVASIASISVAVRDHKKAKRVAT